jgi:hypothetical protein
MSKKNATKSKPVPVFKNKKSTKNQELKVNKTTENTIRKATGYNPAMGMMLFD